MYYYQIKKPKPTEFVKKLNKLSETYWTYSKRYKTFYEYIIYTKKEKKLLNKYKERELI